MCRTEDPTAPGGAQRPHDADHRPDRHAGREHRARHRRLGPRAATTARSSTRTCGCRSRTSSGSAAAGHQAAQDRLGAGRVYHCMNSSARCGAPSTSWSSGAMTREVHGGLLETKQFIQGFIADSLHRHPGRAPHDDPLRREDGQRRATPAPTSPRSRSSCPPPTTRVVDRAIQVWGAAGVSGDLPLEAMYQGARTLRLADGPDEVHRILIAKNVLQRYHGGELGLRELTAPPTEPTKEAVMSVQEVLAPAPAHIDDHREAIVSRARCARRASTSSSGCPARRWIRSSRPRARRASASCRCATRRRRCTWRRGSTRPPARSRRCSAIPAPVRPICCRA